MLSVLFFVSHLTSTATAKLDLPYLSPSHYFLTCFPSFYGLIVVRNRQEPDISESEQ